MPETPNATQVLTKCMKQATETYIRSLTFVKQLTVAAVSTVTYLRNIFSKDNYDVETFAPGLKIRILKNKCNDELAQFLSVAMTQAFKALDKKYLHQFVLCFFDGDCRLRNLIECHVFEYSYKPDGMSMSINSKGRDSVSEPVTFTLDNVREKTMQLIRAWFVTVQETEQQLPDNFDVCVYLYYNEDAPEGYQVPGFIAPEDTEDPLDHTYDALLKLGHVETPFHQLVMRSYTKDTTASNESIPSENPPVMTQASDEFHSSLTREPQITSEPQITATYSGQRVRCVCNNYEGHEPGVMLICIYCDSLQHATCYGVPAERAAGVAARHCCVTCSNEDSTRTPTDARLASFMPNKRQSLAIFRRSLDLCAKRDCISTSLLGDKLGMPQSSAVKLMKMLQNSGIIERHSQASLTTSLTIDHNQLKIVTSQYQFQTGEENIADRLVAETFSSQNSQSNLVEDVLRPLEKVSLQNASQLGTVIQNPEVIETPNTDYQTIKQYKEAMILVERDENVEKTITSHGAANDMEKLRKRAVKRNEGGRTKRARIAKK